VEMPLHVHDEIILLSFGWELPILGLGVKPQNWTMWQSQGRLLCGEHQVCDPSVGYP
jgi:hypothetical protein